MFLRCQMNGHASEVSSCVYTASWLDELAPSEASFKTLITLLEEMIQVKGAGKMSHIITHKKTDNCVQWEETWISLDISTASLQK